MNTAVGRRQLLGGAMALGGGLACNALLPAWARSASSGVGPTLPTLSGPDISLTIARTPFTVGGRTGQAVTMNGVLPAPLLRLKEGQNVRLAVTNRLEEDTSIHWHGLLVPFQFDGVPGVSFPGIGPGETFVYEFPVKQYGTYWYHSHSGYQEQLGHYGPIIIDQAEPDPVAYDREHVIVLSDWTFMDPAAIIPKLKTESGYFNFQKQTLAGLMAGKDQPMRERLEWGQMRMDPTDISDVTGSTYSYLVNGHGPQENWTGLFAPGERVRLRFINASAMTIFNVRIPDLSMTVVQADGQNVRPVDVDEFQISVAETYDVIIQPPADRAFTLVAEAIDRSGMGRATLAPREGMTAPVPPLRKRPLVTMKDMGMGAMDHGAMPGMDHSSMPGMDHSAMVGAAQAGGHDMAGMSMRDPKNAPQVKMGPGVQMISPMPVDRTGDPGIGLEDVGHKVLVYRDLVALEPNPDPRPPSRSVEIHLTGNMERFMWSFDGVKFSEVKEPIAFRTNERVRVTLVNDSMMSHPIHLHGHFFEIVNGHEGHYPRKHTVNVLPGGKVSFDLTADEPGDWAFHCHLLYHMLAGMFQVVSIRPLEGEAA
ncbi:copper resistance system multicopper oxidase [Caulobacter sp. 17J65-9]|uniref:copper resistance system multicopper oxidase n=1 Tax=Caulobacter sp. 17J65-9 TaxID=2709382 RepID=UPI0013C6084F|nr:copper resistance system multicopper oxidase [Caulobacter sp. 17J65-9]NEX91244.1 copper resistance system multicopper oxidase [Caulobacter sp. 17J65-9]